LKLDSGSILEREGRFKRKKDQRFESGRSNRNEGIKPECEFKIYSEGYDVFFNPIKQPQKKGFPVSCLIS